MRILMLDNEFPPLGGGTGVVNLRLLQELAKREEIEVDLVTSSCTKDTYEQEQFSAGIRIFKVPVNNRCIHHSSNRELLTYAVRGYRMCRRLAREKKYDIAFAFAGVPAGGIAYFFSLTHHVPYVVSLQGPDVPGFEQRYSLVYFFLKPVIRRIWRRASGLMAQSEKHRQMALETDPGADIVVIGNGVDGSLFRPRSAQPREAARPVDILTVGRLIERKGHRYLLEAGAELRRRGYDAFRLTFTGTGDSEDELKALSRGLGLEKHVRFAGYLAREEVIACYEGADLFALPSFNEGMSIALLEAIAAGLPVVVTDTGGTAEVVRGNGLVVPWADAVALADALARLIDSPRLREEMGSRSEEIAKEFSWEEVSRQYLAVCRHALAG